MKAKANKTSKQHSEPGSGCEQAKDSAIKENLGDRKIVDAAFAKDLIKILLDKGILALLFLFLGLFASGLLEKWKSDYSFSAELNKTRVTKLGEVWQKIYETDAASDDVLEFIQRNSQAIKAKSITADLRLEWITETEKLINSSILLQNAISSNRFWLGEEDYNEIQNYLNASNELYKTNLKFWTDGDAGGLTVDIDGNKYMKEQLERRNHARANILLIKKRLLGE